MKNLNKMQVKYISNENILIVTTTSTLAPSPTPPLFSYHSLSLSLCYVCKFISMLSAHFNGIKITHTNFP